MDEVELDKVPYAAFLEEAIPALCRMEDEAALCAVRLCPDAKAAILASHVSSEPAGERLLNALGLKAPLRAEMHLGEGGGAVMLMPLLDMAMAVYGSGQSFGRLGIEPYRPLN